MPQSPTPRWWRRARKYIARVTTCGSIAPPPGPRAMWIGRRLMRLVAWIQVGPIRVRGQQHLLRTPSPCIIAPNHPHYADGVVLPGLIDAPARYLASRGLFTFGWGLGALIFGPMGGVAVDLRPGRGGPAVDAGIRILTAGERLILFPEGWAAMDGRPGRYKTGTVRIAIAAAATIGQPVPIIPVFFRYPRYPGSWIRRLSPRLQYWFVFLASPWYRRGVDVVVGEPLYSDELPFDVQEATDMLRERIEELDPCAPTAPARRVLMTAGS